MIHQPTPTPAEFRRTELWQSIAPAIAQANSGAALDAQCAIASRQIVEQAGPNVGLGLVELVFKRSLTHLAWANTRIYPWRVAIGHIETNDARIIGLHPKTALSSAIHRVERTLVIQGHRLDLWIITAPKSDYRLKRFITECNPHWRIMDSPISRCVELPETLDTELARFLDRSPDWDQDRVVAAALNLFLLQNWVAPQRAMREAIAA